jgi:hypothetical protein
MTISYFLANHFFFLLIFYIFGKKKFINQLDNNKKNQNAKTKENPEALFLFLPRVIY